MEINCDERWKIGPSDQKGLVDEGLFRKIDGKHQN